MVTYPEVSSKLEEDDQGLAGEWRLIVESVGSELVEVVN